MNTPLARRVYALCLAMTACREAAQRIALEAMTAEQPLRRAVERALCEDAPPDSDADLRLTALDPRERMALLLTDGLHLPEDEAARLCLIPAHELRRLAHRARLRLARTPRQ